MSQNRKFMEYATATAFSLTLSRPMIEMLICFADNGCTSEAGVIAAWNKARKSPKSALKNKTFLASIGMGRGHGNPDGTRQALIRRGLISSQTQEKVSFISSETKEFVPVFYLTKAGILATELAREAGFRSLEENATIDPLGPCCKAVKA